MARSASGLETIGGKVVTDDSDKPTDGDQKKTNKKAAAKGDKIKPLNEMADGEVVEIKGQSASRSYQIKRTGDHYYCT